MRGPLLPPRRHQRREAILNPEPVAIAPAPLPAVVPTPPSEPRVVEPPPSVARSPGRRRLELRHALAAAVLIVSGIIAGMLLRPRSPGSMLPGAAHRVAFDDRLELDPAISPDGKMVAYAAEAGDRFQIFMRQTGGGRAVALTEALPGSHRRPEWSPDGSRIAFQSGGAIYLVDALGGVPELIIGPSEKSGWVAYPAWSPDGREIAYVENWAIYVRPVGGGQARRLSEVPTPHSLAWSPDGKWIACVSGNPVFTFGEAPWGNSTNLGTWRRARSGSYRQAEARRFRSPTRSRSTPIRSGCPMPGAFSLSPIERAIETSIV